MLRTLSIGLPSSPRTLDHDAPLSTGATHDAHARLYQHAAGRECAARLGTLRRARAAGSRAELFGHHECDRVGDATSLRLVGRLDHHAHERLGP